jgi:c-di-GMP-binding flagellar brake protein YcgR
LCHGTSLRLDAEMGERMQTFATRVEDVDDQVLTVLAPMQRLQHRPLGAGVAVRAQYSYARRRYGFVTESIGSSPDGTLQYLLPPEEISYIDRRGAFRLQSQLVPDSVYRLVVDPERVEEPGGMILKCTVQDISEGGVCLSSRFTASSGEWLGLHVNLPEVGELKVRMRVVGIDAPAKDQRNYRLHCVFVEPSRADRDRVARYLIKRQLAMRQRGQL